MRRRNLYLLAGIIVLALAALWIDWPQEPDRYLPPILPWPKSQGIHLNFFGNRFDRQGVKLGLDLQGGTHMVLQADMSKVPELDRGNSLRGVIQVIERRINAYGVGETIVQAQGDTRVIVELPGIQDIEEAKKLIGQTAQLDFREQGPPPGTQPEAVSATPTTEGPTPTPAAPTPAPAVAPAWVPAMATGSDGTEKHLTGAYLRPNSQVTFDQTNRPQVAFEFDDEGTKLFEQITTRLLRKPLGIFLDNELISAPVVQAVISRTGVITGLSLNEARTLAIQLNAGALPVPVSVVEERSVDATLGADSVRKSVIAGEIALLIVAIFMIAYYRLPGVLATLALLVYTLLVLAVFKLIPVVLTLAGIAGFILSVGMAVDANILIFERTREELRAGKTIGAAVDAGFQRAWPSIRDSNLSTLITCAILFWFGSNFGANVVMGFALTLALGVVISMFSAITVTRTFLWSLVGTALASRLPLFGLEAAVAPGEGLARPQPAEGRR